MSSNSKLIVVLGATGIQGGSVVKTLLDDPNWKIRGLTRNASSDSAKALEAKGVEMVSANLDDVKSLVSAFKGASAIFAVTDFWGPMMNPANKDKPKPGQPMNHWAYEYEKQQGQNVFDAAAKIDGLEKLIFSSLSDIKKWSGGKYTHGYHFDSKAHAVAYGQETYPDLWKKTSIIQVGMYLSNILAFPAFAPTKGPDGVYNFVDTVSENTKLPYISTEEDTGPFVKALLTVPPGKNLIAYREWSTQKEFISKWSKFLNVKAKLVPRTYAESTNIMGPDLAEEFLEMRKFFDEHGYEASNDPSVIHPKDLGVPVHLGTVEEWIEKQDWSPIVGSKL